MKTRTLLSALSALSLCVSIVAPAAPGQERPRPVRPPRISLAPDDKPAFDHAPKGFDVKRNLAAHGRVELVEYESKTVGTRRKALVYTPPGYSRNETYPVLYLLHGIGGDETRWQQSGSVEAILDNLYAVKKLVPMIVVMPNGRAQKNDRPEGNLKQSSPAFAVFEKDLLDDLIPFVESRYPVTKDRASRAIAGLSMGGGQALNFGLGHLDTFAWVGAFSAAWNTKPPEQLVPRPEEAARTLRLLWISCGDQDGLLPISQGVHRYLTQKGVPHVWHVEPGGHAFNVWKNDLYLFAQRIFR